MRWGDRPLLRNVFSSGVSALCGAALTALSVRTYLAALGLERYGLWAALSVFVSLIHLSSFGVGPALTTRAAELKREDNLHSLEETLAISYLMVVGLGVGFGIFGRAANLPIARFLGLSGSYLVEGSQLVPWVALFTTASLAAQIVSSTLVGLGRADLASMQSLLSKLLQFVFCCVLLERGLGVKALVWGNTLGALGQVVMGEAVLRGRLGVAWRLTTRPDFANLRPLLRLGAKLAFGSSFQIGLVPFSKWLLSRTAGLEAVSVYEIAWSVAMQLRTLAAAAFQPTVPEFARHKGHPERTRQLLAKSYRSLTLGFTPAFVGIALGLPWLLRLWLGSGYSVGLLVPTYISLASAWASMLGLPGYYCLLGEGAGSNLVHSQALHAAANVAFGLVLSAMLPFSPTLAAIAMFLAVFGSTVYLAHAARRAR
jgi:O-antigen/teichoic acid export membrane protein